MAVLALYLTTQREVVKNYWFIDGAYSGRNESLNLLFDTPGLHELKIGVVLEDEFRHKSEMCNSTVV